MRPLATPLQLRKREKYNFHTLSLLMKEPVRDVLIKTARAVWALMSAKLDLKEESNLSDYNFRTSFPAGTKLTFAEIDKLDVSDLSNFLVYARKGRQHFCTRETIVAALSISRVRNALAHDPHNSRLSDDSDGENLLLLQFDTRNFVAGPDSALLENSSQLKLSLRDVITYLEASLLTLMAVCASAQHDVSWWPSVRDRLHAATKLTARDRLGRTALMQACDEEDEDKIIELLEAGADVHAVSNDGSTALLIACKQGLWDVVGALLEEGASPHLSDHAGIDALIAVTSASVSGTSKTLDILNRFLDKGVKPQHVTPHGFTDPLWWAFNNAQIALADRLLHAGANVFAVGPEPECSPVLHEAISAIRRYSHSLGSADPKIKRMEEEHDVKAEQLALLIIERGVDVNVKDSSGYSSFSDACFRSRRVAAEMLRHGADVNYRVVGGDSMDATPLLYISSYRSRDDYTAQLLISNGADIHAIDWNGCSALWYASEHGATAFAQLLIDKGADVNVQTVGGRRHQPHRPGMTSMMIAIENRHPEVVKLLLQANARMDLVDCNQKSAFALAIDTLDSSKRTQFRIKESEEIVKLLDEAPVQMQRLGVAVVPSRL